MIDRDFEHAVANTERVRERARSMGGEPWRFVRRYAVKRIGGSRFDGKQALDIHLLRDVRDV